MIYIISTENDEFVKIGYTSNKYLTKRLDAIKLCCPYKLRVELFIEGDINYEREIHEMFKSSYYQYEWFKFTNDIKLFIENNNHLNKVYTLRKEVRKKSSFTKEQKTKASEMYLSGKSHKEISQFLGCSVSSSETLISRLGIVSKKAKPNNNGKYKIYNIVKKLRDKYERGELALNQLKEELDKYPRKPNGRPSRTDHLLKQLILDN